MQVVTHLPFGSYKDRKAIEDVVVGECYVIFLGGYEVLDLANGLRKRWSSVIVGS